MMKKYFFKVKQLGSFSEMSVLNSLKEGEVYNERTFFFYCIILIMLLGATIIAVPTVYNIFNILFFDYIMRLIKVPILG